jgi:hypothetical protein
MRLLILDLKICSDGNGTNFLVYSRLVNLRRLAPYPDQLQNKPDIMHFSHK